MRKKQEKDFDKKGKENNIDYHSRSITTSADNSLANMVFPTCKRKGDSTH